MQLDAGTMRQNAVSKRVDVQVVRQTAEPTPLIGIVAHFTLPATAETTV